MKKKMLIGLIPLLVILLNFHARAQSASSNSNSDKKTVSKWYASKEWASGLKIKPHKSVNQKEFYRQYKLNNKWWDEAFEFLKTHDLDSLKTGNYVVDSGNVVVTVSELPTKDGSLVNWETHKNFNDLQYIVKGKAKMGVLPLHDPKATVTVPYNPKSDGETYTVTGGELYDATPGSFFIFSPEDIHKPAFKVPGFDTVKKVLIKVRVPQ
jgi:biofilm protein TabA